MNPKLYPRNNHSRDKVNMSNAPQLVPYPQQQRIFYSQQNPPYVSEKQSFKKFISVPKQPDTSLEIKRKTSQINTLHQQYNNLKDQMKKLPEKNKNSDAGAFLRGKERSQQFYVEDENERQLKSESSEQHHAYRKNNTFVKKHQSITQPHLRKSEMHQEETFFNKYSKKHKHQANQVDSNDSKHSKEKGSSSSSQANIYMNKKNSSFQSSPPLPYSKKASKSQHTDIFTQKDVIDRLTPEKQSRTRLSYVNIDRPLNIKSKLQRFSMYIDNNMENIFEKFEDLEKKYLSLDLYFQELKQIVSQKRSSQFENKQISQAKYRQYKFLIGEYEAKIKQVKSENERLEKQLISIRIKEESSRGQMQQSENRLKEFENLEENFEKMKNSNVEIEKKFIQTQSKASRLQKERAYLEGELQRQKARKNYELQQSVVKQQMNISHFISNTTLFGSSEDTDYLRQQISKLQYENKEYEKLSTLKSAQISSLTRSCTQSKMMMEKIKQLNQQLQRQCQKLQRDNVQRELEATEKMCNLNNSIKKKLKQYDNFKDLIVQCLTQIYKKAPKKIRKGYDGEVSNKNRTNKCEVMFKCINSSFTFYEEQLNVMSESLLKDFSISPIELDKLGLQVCLKKIKEQVNSSSKVIDSLKIDNRSSLSENQKLKEQLATKTDEFNLLAVRQEQQNNLIKKARLLALKKDNPSNEFDPRQSTGGNQQLSKRKLEIEKLNKEINRIIQQSHEKYLNYEEQIANLEMKQKQFNAKIVEHQSQKGELTSKIIEKENQIKSIEKNTSELKLQKDALNLKISQNNNENKKCSLEYQSKIQKLESQIQTFKKKMKKVKVETEMNEKTLNTKISIKDKTINDLLEEKKKFTVEVKILSEKLDFAKIMEETKEKDPQKKIEPPSPRFTEDDKLELQSKLKKVNELLNLQESESKNLSSIIKSINITLSQKEKLLEKTQFELRRKEEQIENNSKQHKQKEARKNHINQEYKRIAEEIKLERESIQKKFEQEREKKAKEFLKISKQLQVKQEELSSLMKQKAQQTTKSKEIELKLSQSKRENLELLNLIHKKQEELQQKQDSFKHERQIILELETKNILLEKELMERQQYFKKSQNLMQQLLNQNKQSKIQLEKKEQEILDLINQRQQLNFRLSQDLDAKSDNLKIVRYSHENQLSLVKQQLQATQMNLQTTKEELKIKNNLIAELKQKINNDKKETITSKETREEFDNQVKEYQEEIQNLNNKIDILQEQLEESKVLLQDRETQMDAAKRQKNKYYRILQEKAEYIDQLQQAVKLKFNQVDKVQESQEFYEEMKQQYEENEQRMKTQIEDLHLTIKELEDKSIETINQLKKEITIKQKQIDDLKEEIENQKMVNKKINGQKQEIAKEIQKKEREILSLIQKYEDLKIKASQQITLKSQLIKQEKQSHEQKLKGLQQDLKEKERVVSSQIQHFKAEIETKNIQISSLEQEVEDISAQLKSIPSKVSDLHLQLQLNNRLQKLQNSLNIVQKQHKNCKTISQKIQKEKTQLLAKIQGLENDLVQKLKILENLNFKLESMDSNVNDLEIKVERLNQQNDQLKAKLEHDVEIKEEKEPNSNQLEQKIKQLDQKDYLLQQIKEEHKKALKCQSNQFNSNLQSYRSNLSILQKQLHTYKEANIILALKCESLQRQCRQFGDKNVAQKNFILSQSPSNLDFASVEFDLPQKQNLLRNLLSESWNHKRFSLTSKTVDILIEMHEVRQSAIHHIDEPFQICEQSNFSWPSLEIRQNNDKILIRSAYLQRLHGQIHELLVNKQDSFGPSFFNLHSNSALDVLNCIKYQLVQYRSNMNESILQQLEFIENHQIDFCEDIEPELQDCLKTLSYQISVRSTEVGLHKQFEEWEAERDNLKLNLMRESHKHIEDLKTSEVERERILKDLDVAQQLLKMQQGQIQELIDKNQSQIEEQERYFMSQSQILRKELAKENGRADHNECNYLTVKKAIEKLLDILCSKEDMGEEIEDAFEHISKICDQKDIKIKKNMETYLILYNEQQQLIKDSRQKDERSRKKKGFFGFT